MKVIVALDESSHSDAALHSIQSREWPTGTEIVLFSVVDFGLYDHDGWDTSKLLNLDTDHKILLGKRNQYLEAGKSTLERKLKGCKVTTKVVQGRARHEILRELRKVEPNLLIMGSHGRKGFQRLVLGSVAESVLVNALCPVEIVKIQNCSIETEVVKLDDDTELEKTHISSKHNKVLIGIQDQNCIQFLANFLIKYPLPEDVQIRVMHTVVPLANHSYIDIDGMELELANQVSTERWRLGKKYVEQMLKSIDLCTPYKYENVKEVIEEGDPKVHITKQIEEWKPDLLILGSHGKKGFKSLGSVSRHLVTNADCDVCVIPLFTEEEKEERLDKERKLHIIV